jgi:NTP pyrophosphatase (non-canonical NTP hydrolase)
MNEIDTIARLTQQLVDFRNERDWERFHNPKDLAIALSIEAAELQELFLWKDHTDPDLATPATRARLEEETADVAAFLFMLCERLNIDLASALEAKIKKNAEKYPAHLVRGSSKKYSEYRENQA